MTILHFEIQLNLPKYTLRKYTDWAPYDFHEKHTVQKAFYMIYLK